MSDVEDLKIILRAEVDQAIAGLKKASREGKNAEKDWDGISKSFQSNIQHSLSLKNAFSQLSMQVAGGIAIYQLAGKALQAIGQFAKESIEEYQGAAESLARLNAQVKATGGAAGFTGTQLRSMAEDLMAATKTEHESIEGAQSALMKFTSITGSTFERSIGLALDLSKVLGTDASSAAQTLGKAIEKPAEGFGALRKAGVMLDDSVESNIKKFEELGEHTKAQNALLDALASRVGGVAAAIGKEDPGRLKTYKLALSELREEMGKAISSSGFMAAWRQSIIDIADSWTTALAKYNNYNDVVNKKNSGAELSVDEKLIQLEGDLGIAKKKRYQLASEGLSKNSIITLAAYDDEIAAIERQITLYKASSVARARLAASTSKDAQAAAAAEVAAADKAAKAAERETEFIKARSVVTQDYKQKLSEIQLLLDVGQLTNTDAETKKLSAAKSAVEAMASVATKFSELWGPKNKSTWLDPILDDIDEHKNASDIEDGKARELKVFQDATEALYLGMWESEKATREAMAKNAGEQEDADFKARQGWIEDGKARELKVFQDATEALYLGMWESEKATREAMAKNAGEQEDADFKARQGWIEDGKARELKVFQDATEALYLGMWESEKATREAMAKNAGEQEDADFKARQGWIEDGKARELKVFQDATEALYLGMWESEKATREAMAKNAGEQEDADFKARQGWIEDGKARELKVFQDATEALYLGMWESEKATREAMAKNAGEQEDADFKARQGWIEDGKARELKVFQDATEALYLGMWESEKATRKAQSEVASKEDNLFSLYQGTKEAIDAQNISLLKYAEGLRLTAIAAGDASGRIEQLDAIIRQLKQGLGKFESVKFFEDLKKEIKDVARTLAASGIYDTLSAIGGAMASGESSADAFGSSMKQFFASALQQTSMLALNAGLRLIVEGGLPMLPVAIGLLALGGVSAIAAGAISASGQVREVDYDQYIIDPVIQAETDLAKMRVNLIEDQLEKERELRDENLKKIEEQFDMEFSVLQDQWERGLISTQEYKDQAAALRSNEAAAKADANAPVKAAEDMLKQIEDAKAQKLSVLGVEGKKLQDELNGMTGWQKFWSGRDEELTAQLKTIDARIKATNEAQSLPEISAAKYGADFITSGTRLLKVGDNPGGRERVRVEPIGTPNRYGPSGEAVIIQINAPIYGVDDLYGKLEEAGKKLKRCGRSPIGVFG